MHFRRRGNLGFRTSLPAQLILCHCEELFTATRQSQVSLSRPASPYYCHCEEPMHFRRRGNLGFRSSFPALPGLYH